MTKHTPVKNIKAGYKEMKANACLISAAPELLAMCKDALNYVSGRPENWAIGLAENLRKVITKAEMPDLSYLTKDEIQSKVDIGKSMELLKKRCKECKKRIEEVK